MVTKKAIVDAVKEDPTILPPIVIDLDNSVMEEGPLTMECTLQQNQVSQKMFIYDNFDRNKPFTITGWGKNGIDVKMEQDKKKLYDFYWFDIPLIFDKTQDGYNFMIAL